VELRPGSTADIPRGRVLGGSGAVNGSVWMRATPADGWDRPGWTWAEMLARYVRSESDADVGGSPGPAETDKNADTAPGAGLVPGNAVDGMRVNPAMAYLRDVAGLPLGSGDAPVLQSDALTVRGDSPVERVVLDGTRAVGVRLTDGTTVHAGEVVLAAGSVGTPHLLLRSGIGPADDLRAAGLEVGTTWPASAAASPTTPPSSCPSPRPTRPRPRTPALPRQPSTSMRVRTRRATARCCSSRGRSSPTVPCTSCAS
jgi:choline dehydrogenase